MVNKLRMYTGVGGGALVVISIWAASHYSGPWYKFLFAALIGGGIVATPYLLAYGKLHRERVRQTGLDESIFASPPLGVDRESFLQSTAAALDPREEFVDVKRREFPEGDGLIVDHTRFHGTFIRLTSTGRAVVTGIKGDATSRIVDRLEQHWSHPFSRQESNPFLRPIPVRGLPRATLTIALTILILLDAGFIAGLAYPNPVYNPAERATLVALDGRATLDPDMDEVDAKLSKAAFLVMVLEEEATEIRWQAGINESKKHSVNDAPVISADIRTLLNTVAANELRPDQRRRLENLRVAHQNALTMVDVALREPAPTVTPPDFEDPFGIIKPENTTNQTAERTATVSSR